MEMVKLSLGQHNMLGNAEQRWFIDIFKNDIWVLSTQCPHRGGPLQLGKSNADTGDITCPWHGNTISFSFLQKKALPAVRVNEVVQIVAPGIGLQVWYEKIILNQESTSCCKGLLGGAV